MTCFVGLFNQLVVLAQPLIEFYRPRDRAANFRRVLVRCDRIHVIVPQEPDKSGHYERRVAFVQLVITKVPVVR